MRIITTKKELTSVITEFKQQDLKIGLVPTMGALHNGHISLINKSKDSADITVASIFVNPTQFNNADDLLKYPKTIEKDIQQLETANCDILFYPSVEEMYSENEEWNYEVGALDSKLEGALRPGHYKGVTQVVYKLFSLAQPDIAFFGQKDYQQVLVIKKMVKDFNLPIEIETCEIIREEKGLAKSSRNVRLNEEEKNVANTLHSALTYIKHNYDNLSLTELEQNAKAFFNDNNSFKLEYLKICDKETLDELTSKKENGAVVLIACYVGQTRLIDNILIP